MFRRLRFVALVTALAVVCGTVTSAAGDTPAVKPVPKGIEGIWEGPLKVGPLELRLAFKIKKDKDGKLIATMDSIDQGAKDIPCEEVSFADRKLTLGLPKLKAKYVATLAADGQSIKGEFEQAGMKMSLEMKRVEKISTLNRPQTPKKPFPYPSEDVTFENKKAGIKLAGTLTLPKGDGPFPAVVLISGSGAQDRDETLFGHKPFLVIADHFARNGISVLRYDDRGVGKSSGKHEAATSADFATDAFAAVKYLQGRQEIDAKRIGLMGHSEGGLIAPMVAADNPDDVGFIILLAGPGLPGDEVVRGQTAAIHKAMGEKPEALKLIERLSKRLISAAKVPGKADERKAKLEKIAKEFFAALSAEEKKLLGEDGELPSAEVGRLADPWMQFFLTFDPRKALEKVRCPVLAINGEFDLQVLHAENLAAIEKAVRAGGNDRVIVKMLPGLNHLFQHTKTGILSEYGQIEQTFAPEALEFVTNWVLKLK